MMIRHVSIPELLLQLQAAVNPHDKLELLEQWCSYSFPIPVSDAENFARRQLDIARSIGDGLWIVRARINLARCAGARGELESEQQQLQLAWKLLERMPDQLVLKARVSRVLALSYSKQHGEPRSVEPLIFDSVEYARRSGDETQVAMSLSTLFLFHHQSGRREEALACLTEALPIFERHSMEGNVADALARIGMLYIEVESWGDALEFERRSLESYGKIGYRIGQAEASHLIGVCYRGLNDIDNAIAYVRQAIDFLGSDGDPMGRAFFLRTLGSCHLARKEHGRAMSCLDECLEVFERVGNALMAADIRVLKASVMMSRGEWRKGIDIVKGIVDEIADLSPLQARAELYRVLSEAYEKTGEMEAALVHYKKFMEIEQERFGTHAQRALAMFNLSEELARKKREQHTLERKARELEETRNIRQAELEHLSRQVARSKDFLTGLRNRIHVLDGSNENMRDSIRAILNDMDRGGEMAGAWESFQRGLEQLDPEFMHTLTSRCPSLTRAEIRICSLLRMKLSAKEAASLLNLSVRTIDAHRMNIRKKLELKRGENLVAALAGM